ncbi:hypothetical protein EU546_01765 [Candidatus Thorarchaeota archaeon]|nr:MAG: hypothetical protein EU546_01765 [Candidatus Thorarchaeota archaeon]
MNWIRKIIEDKADEFCHARILKYGIGTHPGPRVKLRFTSNRITFMGDLGFEEVFLKGYLNGAPPGNHKVSGKVVTYEDRKNEFDKIQIPLTWKKSGGKRAPTFQASFKGSIPTNHLHELLEMSGPTTFFLLSMSPKSDGKPWKVTMKKSFPKARTSDDEEDEKNPNFVKGAFENNDESTKHVLTEVLPDFRELITEDVKNVYLHQDIVIEDIEIPEEEGLSFAELRKKAKKKGRLVRRLTVDDEEHRKEYSFFV